ncbi:capsule biosynthesis protein [Sulfitobacter sp. 20_GPM-1509m]|uniref:capsule biosynthesis protein n=1 Tax=Sulfitobacter sp. 20_GPM-1509m TaxID=1380367 RepID=UPI0020C7A823|nr:capsule biosynthesis protein [Sulfitobacter sp. 20_GPM-1509m]
MSDSTKSESDRSARLTDGADKASSDANDPQTAARPDHEAAQKPRRIGAGPAVRTKTDPAPAVGSDGAEPPATGLEPAGVRPPQGPPRSPEMKAARAAKAEKHAKKKAAKAEAKAEAKAAKPTQAPTPAPAAVQPEAAQPAKPAAAGPAPRPPVAAARAKRRHWVVLLSFLICVALPAGIVAAYLWTRAADQYASSVGFSVRKEEVGSAVEILGGITALSGSSSSDTDILYEFLQSQRLVADINDEIDLWAIWGKAPDDPWFRLNPGGSIEDLMAYWERMVTITYDSGAGLIDVRALAFDPDDATAISEALFDRSSEMINNLSAIAREDAIRYAREELETAVERLKLAREAITRFRNANQMVDPSQDTQVQAGLLGTLQGQLAESLIDLDILRDTTRDNDPRLTQAQRRVEVIQDRIAAERQKMGLGGDAQVGEVFANLVSEYERLVVDREFAERTYISALAAFDASQAEARRKSRYLAAHVLPTRAETSRFPERGILLALTTLFLFLAWGILTLLGYALRDRK